MILKFEILIFYFCIIIKLSASTDDDIKFLIAQMDVYDKCGQMTQVILTFELKMVFPLFFQIRLLLKL